MKTQKYYQSLCKEMKYSFPLKMQPKKQSTSNPHGPRAWACSVWHLLILSSLRLN
jgi:hypothetical protein